MRIISVILISIFLISCGGADSDISENIINEETPTVNIEYTAEDFTEYLPADFTAYNWETTETGAVFAVARESEDYSPHILLIKNGDTVKISKPFMAINVEFGSGKSWDANLDKDGEILGYSVSIDLGTGDIPGYFVKIFASPDFSEIPCELGAGYVARDFLNIDGSEGADLLFIDTRWSDVPLDLVAGQPFTQAVCEYKHGKFVDATTNHPNQMDPGLKQFKEGLQVSVDENDVLYYAINLMLTMHAMGKKTEAVEGFAKIPDQLSDERRIKFAKEISEHVTSCLSKNKPLTPPWFNPKPEPAWTPLEFERVEVKQ